MNWRKQDYFVISLSMVYFFNVHLVKCAAPNGCTYNVRQAVCDFTQWNPPLSDSDFGPKELHGLTVEKVNGVISTEVCLYYTQQADDVVKTSRALWTEVQRRNIILLYCFTARIQDRPPFAHCIQSIPIKDLRPCLCLQKNLHGNSEMAHFCNSKIRNKIQNIFFLFFSKKVDRNGSRLKDRINLL